MGLEGLTREPKNLKKGIRAVLVSIELRRLGFKGLSFRVLGFAEGGGGGGLGFRGFGFT